MSAWRRRGQRSNLVGGVRCRSGYRVCGDDEGAAGPGCAKTPLQGGRKIVPGLSPGSAEAKGEETSGSENKTRSVAAGLPGRAVARLGRHAGAWRSAATLRTARCGVCVRASLQVADEDDLIPSLDLT
jgi:hypothetical protein